jgi:hypothetical protein
MRNLFKDAWNRCDECGRFIAYDDFLTNKATVRQIAPSSEWTDDGRNPMSGPCKEIGCCGFLIL